MTPFDWLYLALVAVGLVANPTIFLPMFRRRSAQDQHKAKRWLWFTSLSCAWTFLALGIALWAYEGRTWRQIGLSTPEGWRLLGSVVLILIVVAVYAREFAGNDRAT